STAITTLLDKVEFALQQFENVAPIFNHSCLLRSDLVKGIECNAHAETRVSIFPASRRSSGPRVSEITQPWRGFSQVACGSPDAEIELGRAALKRFGSSHEPSQVWRLPGDAP